MENHALFILNRNNNSWLWVHSGTFEQCDKTAQELKDDTAFIIPKIIAHGDPIIQPT